MIGKTDAWPTLGVSNMEEAKEFYGEVLGLELAEGTAESGVFLYKSGDGLIQVYQTDFAGTNKATAVTWKVDDVNAEVAELKTHGVTFEHYPDMPGVTLEGDVHVTEDGIRAAWFADLDGNILSLVQ